MPTPQLLSSAEAAEQVSCDVLLVGAFREGEGAGLSKAALTVDEALDGALSEHLADIAFAGKPGQIAEVPTLRRLPARSIVVVGLGAPDPDPTALRRASGAAARRVAKRSVVASTLHQEPGSEDALVASAEGFLLGTYTFTTYKSDPHPSKIQRVLFLDAAQGSIERGQILAEGAMLARDLTNEPAFALYPEALAERCRQLADAHELECTVFEEDELARRGFGGLLAVGAGSARRPRLIQLHWAPPGAKARVALVGKGVTFDSGGLSLKDLKGMETMKTDKGGAAAVIGAMTAVARLKVPVEVTALIPATENMPGGDALKPGDVITHYGGKTSEVLNTDAEGRLILADALAYACEARPEAIVDVATLTGSIVVALGSRSTGLFSNDDELRDEISLASERAGERVWPMPMYDDYKQELESDVADIKNIGSRWGGSIFAALFLKEFVEDSIPWAHLDIAGASRSDKDRDEISRGGTGVATATLVRWVEGRAS
ncbi:MAG: leucyl aminopeptidase [Actinomycetota bacterium]